MIKGKDTEFEDHTYIMMFHGWFGEVETYVCQILEFAREAISFLKKNSRLNSLLVVSRSCIRGEVYGGCMLFHALSEGISQVSGDTRGRGQCSAIIIFIFLRPCLVSLVP